MTNDHYQISGQQLWEWRSQAQQQAIAAHISEREVDWLLEELAGLDRLTLHLASFKTQPQITLPISLPALQKIWQQRVEQRIPVQYLVGFTPWRQFRLKVSKAVLIPRPETEGLIDLAIAAVPPNSPLRIGDWADLGTGSGAIALGLAQSFPQAKIHAVDCSSAALEIARANVTAYGFTSHIHLYQGNWLEPLADFKGHLSGIVSNPPYIPTDQVFTLQPEVTCHEPHLALDGGPDGLDCIRYLVKTAVDYLQPNGVLLFEMMAGQGEAVKNLLTEVGAYRSIQIHPDLAGLDRYAIAYKF